MNLHQHYWNALEQYAQSSAQEPPSRLIATPNVVQAFEREGIKLDGVHVIYTQNDRPVLRVE